MVTTTFKIVKLVKSLQASPKETTDRVSLPANLDVDYFWRITRDYCEQASCFAGGKKI